jgi:hypothetical protein
MECPAVAQLDADVGTAALSCQVERKLDGLSSVTADLSGSTSCAESRIPNSALSIPAPSAKFP